MDIQEKHRVMNIMYEEAKKFLVEIVPEGIDLNEYYEVKKNYKTKNELLYNMLVALQNNQMLPNVIGITKTDRKDIFKRILFDYDCDKILMTYTKESLFNEFNKNFAINNYDSGRNSWKKYSGAIISACNFINKFNDVEDFSNFIDSFYFNDLTRAALPALLEKEVEGLGFPLACNFIKDLGYLEYPKPDVHIMKICAAFDLCEEKPYDAYKTIVEMSNVVGESAFKIDRVFWLICSGNYFLHEKRIKGKRDEYISRVKMVLEN